MAMALTNGRCPSTTRSRRAILADCWAAASFAVASAFAVARVCSVLLTAMGLAGGLDGAAPLRGTARSLLCDVLVLIWCGGSWSAGATAAALEFFSLMFISPTPLKRHALGQSV